MSVNHCYHQPTRSESRGLITSNNCVLKSAIRQRYISQTFRNNDILIEPSPPTWVPHPSLQWDAFAFLVLEMSDLHPVHHLCDVCGGGGGVGFELRRRDGREFELRRGEFLRRHLIFNTFLTAMLLRQKCLETGETTKPHEPSSLPTF